MKLFIWFIGYFVINGQHFEENIDSLKKRISILEDELMKCQNACQETNVFGKRPSIKRKGNSEFEKTKHLRRENNSNVSLSPIVEVSPLQSSVLAVPLLDSNLSSFNTSDHIQELISNILAISSSTYDDHLFYMYELDEEFWWRWPAAGSDCSENGYVGHEHAALSGMGIPILPDQGLYLTWHFSLFSSLYNRMKRSRRRTYDPTKASLFVIPYDLGLDGYVNHDTCQNSRQCTRGLAQRLQTQLERSKYWQRHQGADHAVLWSLGQYHPWPRNGCDIFMRDFCAKCSFTSYWMDSTKPESRFVSVPFPAAYHWRDGIQHVPWDITYASQRHLLAVYLGSTQTLNPAHTKIRRAMTTQCNASASCTWTQIAHSSKDSSIADALTIYQRAVFCLCPPGDDPARKAVFDSILSGCIPVIFQKETLYNQYPWHLGEELALDISVSIPGALVRSGKLDFMSVLESISLETIRKKQAALMRAAPRVQYAMPPDDLLMDPADATPWDPPFPDGVDLVLDGLFQRVKHVLSNESTGIPSVDKLQKSWHQQYDVVIVKIPGDNIQTKADGESGGGKLGKSFGVGGEHKGRKKGHKILS